MESDSNAIYGTHQIRCPLWTDVTKSAGNTACVEPTRELQSVRLVSVLIPLVALLSDVELLL